jgi:uncharacterized protein (DUF1778 family)
MPSSTGLNSKPIEVHASTFELPADRWREFQAALDRPVQAKPRLKELLALTAAQVPRGS